jgi:Conserved TM helix
MPITAAVNVVDSLQQAFDSFFGFLPNLLGFLIILVIGYIVARVVKGILTKVLEKVGLDRALHSGQTGQYVERLSPDASPSRLVGAIAFWFVFLGALSLAVSALKIPALTTFVATIYGYLPNVIAAVLIFVLAGAIAAAVAGLVTRIMGDTPTGKLVVSVVPVLIMGIAVFMILNQLGIAPAIVTITYAVLLGSVGLGMALAFGLGGRETAARLVSDAYDKGQERQDQVKLDMKLGKERSQREAERAKQKLQGKTSSRYTPAPQTPPPPPDRGRGGA